MSQPPSTPSEPTPSTERSGGGTAEPRRRPPSALALAAMAAAAVPGLDPARLALPQTVSRTMRVVGVIDTQGRHWEVLEARDDATGASLDAEAEVLRRIGRVADDGRLSFDVPRPAGTLRRDGVHVQVRTHVEGRSLDLESLRPGPGLSAGLGRALGELHELPGTVLSEAGLPVYDAEEVRQQWISVLDEAAQTGRVPAALLSRWEGALDDIALWRFRPVVVHSDLAPENVLKAGGAVVAIRGLAQAHVGDPAEDLAWVYSSAPVDCLDSIEAAYDLARSEGVDKHLRDRAELISEMSLARWLLHGMRSQDESVIEDAVAMLEDLAEQVGEEPLVEVPEPRLAPVPGTRESAEPEAATREVAMVAESGSSSESVSSSAEDDGVASEPYAGSASEDGRESEDLPAEDDEAGDGEPGDSAETVLRLVPRSTDGAANER